MYLRSAAAKGLIFKPCRGFMDFASLWCSHCRRRSPLQRVVRTSTSAFVRVMLLTEMNLIGGEKEELISCITNACVNAWIFMPTMNLIGGEKEESMSCITNACTK